MKVTEETFITIAEARKILEKKEATAGELGYEQKNALEHLKRFSKLGIKKTEEMADELKKIEKLKERHIAAIINMLPNSADEVRILFSNEMVELTDEDTKKILGIVKKFA